MSSHQETSRFHASDSVDLPCDVTADHDALTLSLSFGGHGGASVTMDAETGWRLALRIQAKVLALRHTERGEGQRHGPAAISSETPATASVSVGGLFEEE